MNWRRGKQTLLRILRGIAVFGISTAAVFAMLLCVNAPEALNGIRALLLSGFASAAGLHRTLLYWPVLMLTGLSVGYSWKAGYFNAAVPGECLIGAYAAMSACLLFSLPWWVCLILALLGGAVSGALLGMIKNRSRTSEVIFAVMLNYTALHLTQWLWEDALRGTAENASLNASQLPVFHFASGASISLALPVAVLICIVFWALLQFTAIGYEMKAGGSNSKAARRAGMPVEKNGRIALILAGAFSGLAGGICLLSGTADFSAVSALSLYMGLAGIPVAMMSYGHPLGIMITALAAAGICAGGDSLPAVFPSETGTILLALTLLGNAVFQRKRQ